MSEGVMNHQEESDGRKENEARVQQLQQQLEALKGELEAQTSMGKEYLDLAKRIQADFDNYKKRALRDKEEIIRSANDRLMADLLGTLDDLERALASGANNDELRRGVTQVQGNLMSLLRSYGLSEMPMEGQFDPNLHEAMASCEGEEGRIYETYQKGYLVGSRVIRHAKVKVGRKEKEGESNG